MRLEGYKSTRLLTTDEAMQCLLDFLYAGRSLQRKTFEKRDRNAEIYRRYLAGEDSVVLGRIYGLGDRRIRDIIEHERNAMVNKDRLLILSPLFEKGAFLNRLMIKPILISITSNIEFELWVCRSFGLPYIDLVFCHRRNRPNLGQT